MAQNSEVSNIRKRKLFEVDDDRPEKTNKLGNQKRVKKSGGVSFQAPKDPIKANKRSSDF